MGFIHDNRFASYCIFSRTGFKVDGEVRGRKWRSANCTRCSKRGRFLGKLRTTVDLASLLPRVLAPRRSNQQILVQILRCNMSGMVQFFVYLNLYRYRHTLRLVVSISFCNITFDLSFTTPYKYLPSKTR